MVRVTGGRRQLRVPEHAADLEQRHPGVGERGRERVPQVVDDRVGGQPRRLSALLANDFQLCLTSLARNEGADLAGPPGVDHAFLPPCCKSAPSSDPCNVHRINALARRSASGPHADPQLMGRSPRFPYFTPRPYLGAGRRFRAEVSS